jgi:hypothetical protein
VIKRNVDNTMEVTAVYRKTYKDRVCWVNTGGWRCVEFKISRSPSRGKTKENMGRHRH